MKTMLLQPDNLQVVPAVFFSCCNDQKHLDSGVDGAFQAGKIITLLTRALAHACAKEYFGETMRAR